MRTRRFTKQTRLAKETKGVHCECGKFEPFTAYVYAHWRDQLTFTCSTCGRKYNIVCGTTELIHVPIAVPGGRKEGDPSIDPQTEGWINVIRGKRK